MVRAISGDLGREKRETGGSPGSFIARDFEAPYHRRLTRRSSITLLPLALLHFR